MVANNFCDHRLIPLAVMCICEAVDISNTFHQQMVSSSNRMPKHSEQYSKTLHDQLVNEIAFMHQVRGGATSEPDAAPAPMKHQDLANNVTGSNRKYLTRLQQAFQSAIGGYDDSLTGNCLLFFAPEQAKVTAADGSDVDGSQVDPSHMEGIHFKRSASKKSAAASKKTVPDIGWQQTSAAWLAVVTFAAGLVLGLGAANCNIKNKPHNS